MATSLVLGTGLWDLKPPRHRRGFSTDNAPCRTSECAVHFYGRLPSSGLMEIYKRETRDLVNRFLLRQLSFPDCISALDSALAGLIPRLRPEDLPALREVIMANNESVLQPGPS